jgi:glycerophosphoryl diester phosphodiesterase
MRRVAVVVAAALLGVVCSPATTTRAAVDCTNQPLIGAHRGAPAAGSGNTENGMRAFQAAAANGAAYIETDLRHTADRHIVVMHDPTLDRTSNLTGRVSSKTLAQIRAGHLNDGEAIPNAATLLGWLRDSGTHADLELKDLGPAAMSLIVKMLGTYHLQPQVHITSLSTNQLDAFRSITTRFQTVLDVQPPDSGTTVTPAVAALVSAPLDEASLMFGASIPDYLDAGLAVDASATGNPQWDAVTAFGVEAILTNDLSGVEAYLTAVCAGSPVPKLPAGKAYPYSTVPAD